MTANTENTVLDREDAPAADLVISLDGFEGPIDLLLDLAREQKLDLCKLAILPLAEQYLSYIAEARRLRLEVAADYLVMAAWLAFLKSRLLLPEPNRPKMNRSCGDGRCAEIPIVAARSDAEIRRSKFRIDRNWAWIFSCAAFLNPFPSKKSRFTSCPFRIC